MNKGKKAFDGDIDSAIEKYEKILKKKKEGMYHGKS